MCKMIVMSADAGRITVRPDALLNVLQLASAGFMKHEHVDRLCMQLTFLQCVHTTSDMHKIAYDSIQHSMLVVYGLHGACCSIDAELVI